MPWLFIYLTAFVISTAICDLKGFQKLKWGYRMKICLIDTVTGVSFLDCMEKCVSRKTCLSINYQSRNLWCELNGYLDYRILDSDQTFVFTDMTSWDKDIAGGCSSYPCKDTEVCIPESGHHICELSEICATGWRHDCGQERSYCFGTEKKTWADAKDSCEKMGAHLAIINSSDVEQFILSKNVQTLSRGNIERIFLTCDRQWMHPLTETSFVRSNEL